MLGGKLKNLPPFFIDTAYRCSYNYLPSVMMIQHLRSWVRKYDTSV